MNRSIRSSFTTARRSLLFVILATGAMALHAFADPSGTKDLKFDKNGNALPGNYNFPAGANFTVKGSAVHQSKRVIYASQIATLDSSIATGGGTDSTAALNTALETLRLAGGGELVLDGAARTTASLVIGSKVTIRALNLNCGIYLTAGSNCHMLVNRAYATGPFLNGYPQVPTAPYDSDISVIGGTWNGNWNGQDRYVGGNPSVFWVCGFWFSGVNGLSIRGVSAYESKTFGIMMSYIGDPTLEDVTVRWAGFRAGSNNDGIHFWGPITGNIVVRNLRVINGSDDALALNFAESRDSNGALPAPFNGGPSAVDTLIDGVYAENVHSVLRVDGLGYDTSSAGKITVRNVYATMNASAAHTVYAQGSWERLVMENWEVKYPSATSGIFRNVQLRGTNPAAITELRGWKFLGDNSGVNFIDSGIGGQYWPQHSLVLDNVHVSKPVGTPSGSLFHFYNQPPGNGWDTVQITNSTQSGYASVCANDSNSANIGQLFLSGNALGTAALVTGNRPALIQGSYINAAGATVLLGAQTAFENIATLLPIGYGSTPTYPAASDLATFQFYQDASNGYKRTLDVAASSQNTTSTVRFLTNATTGGAPTPAAIIDDSTTAGTTRFMLYDVSAGTLKRVSVGAADSGGAGFKTLRVPN